MTGEPHVTTDCRCKVPEVPRGRERERGVLWVVALTFVMMIVEISVGYVSHSMALLADGWHMATHVGALGITAFAYSIARRYATHRAFTFGTGKVNALGGFASSILLGVVALSMLVESGSRIFAPHTINFDQSLPVAVVGLLVNLASVALLHRRDHEHEVKHDNDHEHHHQHDHGHRAAFLHVLADALTSALAIIALLFGRQWGWTWLDPTMGIVGSIVILKWSYELTRTTATELLDVNTGHHLEDQIRAALSALDDGVRLLDLHVWPMGNGRMSCVVTIESSNSHTVQEYREKILAQVTLAHLTVELHRR
jgi:cation diffusion facilitator family transporter